MIYSAADNKGGAVCYFVYFSWRNEKGREVGLIGHKRPAIYYGRHSDADNGAAHRRLRDGGMQISDTPGKESRGRELKAAAQSLYAACLYRVYGNHRIGCKSFAERTNAVGGIHTRNGGHGRCVDYYFC